MATGTISYVNHVPFSTYTVGAGSSIVLRLSGRASGVIFANGTTGAAVRGIQMFAASSSAVSITAMVQASGLSFSTSGLNITVANTASGSSTLAVLMFDGALPTVAS